MVESFAFSNDLSDKTPGRTRVEEWTIPIEGTIRTNYPNYSQVSVWKMSLERQRPHFGEVLIQM